MQMPTLLGSDAELKKDEIKRYFNYCYDRYERLFDIVKNPKAYYQKADPLRYPIIFYYGHTACFYVNKLKLFKAIDDGIDAQMESMFAVGVDEMSWDDLNDEHYDWPSIEETKEYRKRVKEFVNSIIDRSDLALPIEQDSIWWVVLMGIEHENIHLETSSVLIRQLPLEFVQEIEDFKAIVEFKEAPKNELLDVIGGIVNIGKDESQERYFGWDNEYGSHKTTIPPFKASKYLVSNGEFLEFVEDNGYKTKEYWSDEGWQWREFEKAKYPRFWRKYDDGYYIRSICTEHKLSLSHPVEVNYHEAYAFCNWKSKKDGVEVTLPTEDEYIALQEFAGVPNYDKREIDYANIDLNFAFSSCSVDRFKHKEFYDVIGNVWQWTKTPIYPFDGFKVHPIYDDFTVPTFDNKHNLIKGGSFISCGNLALNESRYAFRRHFYQHAGFRYVKSDYKENISAFEYTTDKAVSIYCHFGWSDTPLGFGNYPKKCVELAIKYVKNFDKALDVGCATGRSTFELARYFERVVGVDFSTRFIQEAEKLKESGKIFYTMPTEGELEEFLEIDIKEFGLSEVTKKVEFWQGDACNLKSIFRGYDLIFATNLIDRLYDPKKFLDSLKDRINKDGILFLSSPYSWSEEFTPKAKWLGGVKIDGESLYSFDGIEKILQNDFELLYKDDIEFILKESKRRFQYTIAEATVWRLR